MGRHSSPEQAPYVRSVAGWVIPWVLVAAVAVAGVVVGVSALGQQPIDARPPPHGDRNAQPEPTPDKPSPSEEPSPSPSKNERREKERKDSKDKERKDEEPALITEGVTVQVLNATDDPGADEATTRRLARLGFEIVAVVTAARDYERTTVFWSSSDDRAAARALARRFEWRAGPKPANLSPGVDVHVVIGKDED